MLPLSANPDFKNRGEDVIVNPYYDINADSLDNNINIYGGNALDQAIEMVLCTEPFERLFNLALTSPIHEMLFENLTQSDEIMDRVFNMIEFWVPVVIYRKNAEIRKNNIDHSISFKIPYISLDGRVQNIFHRVISK